MSCMLSLFAEMDRDNPPWRASCYSVGYGWISDSYNIRSLACSMSDSEYDRLLHALTMKLAYLKLSGNVGS